MRRAILVVVLVILIASAGPVACSEPASPASITDDLGREVAFDDTPKAVVSLAPSATEILFAIGLGEAVVGVTDACDYPEEAKGKAKVGAYYATNLELIVNCEPDVVFTDGHDPVGEELQELGIPFVVLQPDSIAGVFANIELVGQVMDEEGEAAALVARLQSRLDAVAAKVEGAAARPAVFLEIDAFDPANPWTTGPGTLLDTMITLAGGRNIVTSGDEWASIGLEELLSAGPDLIILSDYPSVTTRDVLVRAGAWQELSAVKNGRVYAISDPSLTSRSGPRIIEGLEEMARIIHPELFGA